MLPIDNTNDIGVVYQKSTGRCVVHTGERVLFCTISPRLHKELEYTSDNPGYGGRRYVQNVKVNEHTDPVAVGDTVRFLTADNDTGTIIEVLPRRNRLARRSAVPMPGAHPFEQVIAANIDQVIPVLSANKPAPSWHLLDRYLVSAESLDLTSLVLITKLDLLQDQLAVEELHAHVERYRSIGYTVLLTSAATGEGIEDLSRMLRGCVSVLVGKSGVGKSSVLNAVQPGLGLSIQEVNQKSGKGRHTTTQMQMFPLSNSGAVIDTPGIREFGLWDVEDQDLADYFPEMRPLIGRCRFASSCAHNEEPGCAVRQAVVSGQIDPYRYQSYLRLLEEVR